MDEKTALHDRRSRGLDRHSTVHLAGQAQCSGGLVEKIEDKCLLIASQPDMGALRPKLGRDVRCNFVGRYVIFHRRHEDTVEILRVIPGDRNITKL